MPELKVGDTFPEGVAFSYVELSPETSDITTCGIPQKYDATQEFKGKKVVIVSVPGAFTPTCQAAHVPSYTSKIDELKAKGIDKVVFIAYNDAFVMSAWAKANGLKDSSYFVFASDVETSFSKSLGWTLGERTARYAIVVDKDSKILYAAREDGKGIDKSGAEAVLAAI